MVILAYTGDDAAQTRGITHIHGRTHGQTDHARRPKLALGNKATTASCMYPWRTYNHISRLLFDNSFIDTNKQIVYKTTQIRYISKVRPWISNKSWSRKINHYNWLKKFILACVKINLRNNAIPFSANFATRWPTCRLFKQSNEYNLTQLNLSHCRERGY